jgi:hypothetical protein
MRGSIYTACHKVRKWAVEIKKYRNLYISLEYAEISNAYYAISAEVPLTIQIKSRVSFFLGGGHFLFLIDIFRVRYIRKLYMLY